MSKGQKVRSKERYAPGRTGWFGVRIAEKKKSRRVIGPTKRGRGKDKRMDEICPTKEKNKNTNLQAKEKPEVFGGGRKIFGE